MIFDGFPRTTAQAEALDRSARGEGDELDAVISMEVDDERWSTGSRGASPAPDAARAITTRHKRPAVEGVCDKCGATEFKRRADDNAETVRARLEAYHADTAPLIEYYYEGAS